MNLIGTVKKTLNGIARTVTVAVLGPNDANSAPEASPFGIDSNPINGMQAVFMQTPRGRVIIGYFLPANTVLPNQPIALPGETRLYATDGNGNEKTRIWLHSSGEVELGGTGPAATNTNHATQWEGLNAAIQSDNVTFINTELAKIATAINAIAPGAYTPGIMNINLTPAKLTKILVQ